jgi:hypothetical protein
MAEKFKMTTRTDAIRSGDDDAERPAKSHTVHSATASPKFGSSIPENSSSVAEPEIEGVANNNNVILIDDSDSPTNADLPSASKNYIGSLKKTELKNGDSSFDVSSRGVANQISHERELSFNKQHQYQGVARVGEPDRNMDTTKQTKKALAWNTNFVPPTRLNTQAQKQHSSTSVVPNDNATRNALQNGRIFASGHISSFHDVPNEHQAAAISAVQQHQAAASAAEHHLQWRMNAYQGDERNGITRSGLHELSHPKDGPRDQLLEQYTAEVARRLSVASNPSNSDRSSSVHEKVNLQGNSTAFNERKRSLSESEYSGIHPTARRLHHTERRPSNAPTSAQIKSRNHNTALSGTKLSNQTQAMSDTMDVALDEAMEYDGAQTSKASSSSRRVDTPMTYLVRQLLGQVEVYGNEPAVVLSPNVVKEASLKIRAVINKLMEKVAEDAKRESQMQIRQAESRSAVLEETHAAQNMKTAANLAVLEYFANAQQKKEVDDLKTFAEEQVSLVQDRETLIHNLRNQLRASQGSLSILREDLAATKRQNRTPSEKLSNATIRNLITQLDDGMTKLQQQKKEIDALKAVIRKDAESLKGFHEMRMFLISTFGLCDPTTNPPLLPAAAGRPSGSVTEGNPNDLIKSLRGEVEELHAALKLEHERGETALRAYMRAAVHALKMQKESLYE